MWENCWPVQHRKQLLTESPRTSEGGLQARAHARSLEWGQSAPGSFCCLETQLLALLRLGRGPSRSIYSSHS